MLNKKLLLFLILLMPLMMNCRTGGSASNQSAAEARASEQNKEESAKYHDAIKAHDKDQTRETRKRMRELKKKSGKTHVEHKQFFLWRWLSRKPKSCVPQPTN